MIKNIIFDFGGVVITLDPRQAVKRFSALGLPNAEQHLDAYTQTGIFGALEEGKIGIEIFKEKLSALCNKELTHDECLFAWKGYCIDVPERSIEALKKLRKQGYRLIMLSNTNPYMMSWAKSKDFSKGIDKDCPEGRPAVDYFDAAYLSYEVGCMKPDLRFFEYVLSKEGINPSETLFLDDGKKNCEAAEKVGIHALLTVNGEPWQEQLKEFLNLQNNTDFSCL